QGIVDEGEPSPCVIDALGEVSLPLQGSWHNLISRRVRRKLALKFLAPEEKRLVAELLEHFRDVNGSADGVARIVIAKQRSRQASDIVEERVCVQAVIAVIPVAAAVELLAAGLGYKGNLRAYAAAVLGLIGSGEHLEFGDGIHAQHHVL